jgi:hypothetical protein
MEMDRWVPELFLSRFVDRPTRQQGRIRRGTDLFRARPGSQHSNKKFSREINGAASGLD